MCRLRTAHPVRLRRTEILHFTAITQPGNSRGFSEPVASLADVAPGAFAVLATRGAPRGAISDRSWVSTEDRPIAGRPEPRELAAGLLARNTEKMLEVWGSASGTSAVFWGETSSGTYIISDSAAAVATAIGAEIDMDRVALALANDVSVQISESRPFWTGVQAVRPGDRLTITPGSPPRTSIWWTAPSADQDLSTTAASLRGALLSTLSEDIDGRDAVTSDLSGGLDSTSLVFALSSLGVRPTTFRANSTNIHNDDEAWAHRTVLELGLDHSDIGSLGAERGSFDPVDRLRAGLDSPALWRGSIGYLGALYTAIPNTPGTHFTGLGGDELFAFSPILLWSLAHAASPRHPSISRFRALHRWPRFATARAVRSRQDIEAELAADLASTRGRRRSEPASALAWSPSINYPAWMPDDAVARARGVVQHELQKGLRPRDDDRARHQALESLHFQGAVLRQISQAFTWPFRWRAPFLDTRVIEEAMRLDVRARIGATTIKPLLAATMAPFMSQEYFMRNGKGEYSDDIFSALERSRDSLMEFFDDSILARNDLIDLPRLRGAIRSPLAAGDGLGELERIVAVEHWLRAHTFASAQTGAGGISP